MVRKGPGVRRAKSGAKFVNRLMKQPKATFTKGKDDTETLKVQIHFPADYSPEERAVLLDFIKRTIPQVIKNTHDQIMKMR